MRLHRRSAYPILRGNGNPAQQHERQQNRDGLPAHAAIISFSHLDAFDSRGTFRVAPRPSIPRPQRTQNRSQRVVYFIYSFLMAAAAFVLLPYWLIRGIREHKYLSNLRERLAVSLPA